MGVLRSPVPWLVAVLVGPGVARAQTLPDPVPLDRVLARYVSPAGVDYAALQRGRSELDYYLAALGRTSPPDLERAARDERLAFWINAYNACALGLVVDHYPIEVRPGRRDLPPTSVRHLPSWGLELCRVAQGRRSLDGIASRMIAPLGEPRAIFALACPARSCPRPPGEAVRADRLDAQLDAAVRRFVLDPGHVRHGDDGSPTVWLAAWFTGLRDEQGGTAELVRLLARYVPPDLARRLTAGDARLAFAPFDWTLNDAALPH